MSKAEGWAFWVDESSLSAIECCLSFTDVRLQNTADNSLLHQQATLYLHHSINILLELSAPITLHLRLRSARVFANSTSYAPLHLIYLGMLTPNVKFFLSDVLRTTHQL